MRFTTVVLGCFLVLTAVSVSFATNTLGVVSEDGYAYLGSSAPTDDYITYFFDTPEERLQKLSAAVSGVEGFKVGASGSSLTVWSQLDPRVTDIYLMSITGYGESNQPLRFGGLPLTLATSGVNRYVDTSFDGYKYPGDGYEYYGLWLDPALFSWSTTPVKFNEQSSESFYLCTASLTYAGSLSLSDYLFALADVNNDGRLSKNKLGPDNVADIFSPKTTSATGGYPPFKPVPEPGTLALLGMGGLAGLGMLRMKK